jgi:glycosyltransferase involved in cell wall biosynthesis
MPASLLSSPSRLSIASRPFRLLVVQTNPIFSSEAKVLHTILKHVPAGQLDTLLLQGSGTVTTRAGDLFAGLQGVEVDEVPVKRLGQPREGLVEALLKVGTAARLLTYDTLRLIRAAERFKPQAVYSTQRVWDIRLARLLANALRLPRVTHLHYTPGPWLGRGSLRSLRSADLVLCVSHFIRHEAMRFADSKRLRVLHNTADPPAVQDRARCRWELGDELGLPADATLVGMVARLNPLKGQVDLLKAMYPLLSTNPRLHLLVVGMDDLPGNPVKHALDCLRIELGVGKQVHLLGHRSDVPMILSALDVFAHPSRQEPFCLAVLEAMAHKLPVVALEEGGTPEVVVQEQTGILTPPGDENALTTALHRLVTDPVLAHEMGQRGCARVATEFDPIPQSQLFLSLLNDLTR